MQIKPTATMPTAVFISTTSSNRSNSRPMVFQTNDVYVLREVVRAGLGVALVPKISWASVISEQTHGIKVSYPICERSLPLITVPNKYLFQAALNLKDLILQSYREAGETGIL